MGGYARPVPLRTGMAITALVLACLSLCTAAGLVVGGLASCVIGIVALMKANKAPQEYGGKGMAIAAIIISALSLVSLPAVIGIYAAIAIPSLLRARVSANESATIGDLRTMISAQTVYQNANGGAYDTPDCLAAPSNGCIPGYPATGPTFLDPSLVAQPAKSGYIRSFHPGPAPEPLDPAQQSPSSMMSFAYVAVPMLPGRTGVRGFCADHTGLVCFTATGSAPEISNGVCPTPPACEPIR